MIIVNPTPIKHWQMIPRKNRVTERGLIVNDENIWTTKHIKHLISVSQVGYLSLDSVGKLANLYKMESWRITNNKRCYKTATSSLMSDLLANLLTDYKCNFTYFIKHNCKINSSPWILKVKILRLLIDGTQGKSMSFCCIL